MSVVDSVRQNIVSALKAVPAMAGVRVIAATAPDDWIFEAGKSPCALVVYTGLEAAGPQRMAPKDSTGAVLNFLVICASSDYQSGTKALTKTLGADAIAEAARAIRTAPIGPEGQSGAYLHLRSEVLVEHPERGATGGPVAYFCTYQTSHLTI